MASPRARPLATQPFSYLTANSTSQDAWPNARKMPMSRIFRHWSLWGQKCSKKLMHSLDWQAFCYRQQNDQVQTGSIKMNGSCRASWSFKLKMLRCEAEILTGSQSVPLLYKDPLCILAGGSERKTAVVKLWWGPTPGGGVNVWVVKLPFFKSKIMVYGSFRELPFMLSRFWMHVHPLQSCVLHSP